MPGCAAIASIFRTRMTDVTAGQSHLDPQVVQFDIGKTLVALELTGDVFVALDQSGIFDEILACCQRVAFFRRKAEDVAVEALLERLEKDYESLALAKHLEELGRIGQRLAEVGREQHSAFFKIGDEKAQDEQPATQARIEHIAFGKAIGKTANGPAGSCQRGLLKRQITITIRRLLPPLLPSPSQENRPFLR